MIYKIRRSRFAGRLAVAAAVVCMIVAIPVQGQGREDSLSSGSSLRSARRTRMVSSVEFVDTPITTIFKMISDLTGWSIILSPQISEKPPKVNIWIKDMAPEDVLEKVASMAELVIERDGNTFYLSRFDEYARIKGLQQKVVVLKHAAANDLVAVLRPFVAKDDQARILPDEKGNRVVLLAPAGLMESLLGLVQAMDVRTNNESIKVVRLKYLHTAAITPVLQAFLTREGSSLLSTATVEPKTATTPANRSSYVVHFAPESRLNAILLRGRPEDVEIAVQLIEQLDVSAESTIIGYQLKYTTAADAFATLDALLQEDARQVGQQANQRMHVAPSVQNNQVVVEGSAADHARVAELIKVIDRPMPPGTGGIRVYRLENTSAREVAQIIRNIIDNTSGAGADNGASAANYGTTLSGAGRQMLDYGRSLPGLSRGTQDAGRSFESSALSARTQAPAGPSAPPTAPGTPSAGTVGQTQGSSGVDVVPPSVTEAPEINAVVIRASAAEHEEFAKLVKELDKPRNQVLLEVTLVSVRTTNDFNLGLELSYARIGDVHNNIIGFSNFGISAVDPATGALRIRDPAPFGANVAVFNTEDYSLVLNALQTVGDTRISSAPKIVVEDNTQAQISQTRQEPFSVVSQGQTTTTTSFGGFVDAGTDLTVTPHLSKDGWLRLQYVIKLSAFLARVSLDLPPPRAENVIVGTARVPEGYTVVLGGVASSNDAAVTSGIPLVSDVPGLGELFKNRTRSRLRETLFVFIHPVILSDPAFKDLRYLSREDMRQAKLADTADPRNELKSLTPGAVETEQEEAQ